MLICQTASFFTATVITCVRYCAVTARVSQPFRCSAPPEIPEHRVAGTGMRLGAGANICSAVFYRRKNSETLSSNHSVFTSCDTRTRGCNGSRINRTSLHYVSAEGFSTAAGAISDLQDFSYRYGGLKLCHTDPDLTHLFTNETFLTEQ